MRDRHVEYGLVCDERYIVPTSVACLSLFQTASRPIVVHVATSSRELRLLPKVHDLARAGGHTIDYLYAAPPRELHELPDLAYHHHVSTAAWLRFVLFDSSRIGATTLLYLDSDVMIMKPLPEGMNNLLQGRRAAARIDPWNPVVSSPKGVQPWRKLGYAENSPNFNSGVLLVDTLAWTNSKTTEQIFSIVDRYGSDMVLGDQEALNAALSSELSPLPATLNAVVIWDRLPNGERVPRLDPARESPVIRHFAGWRKPWNLEGSQQPHASLWTALSQQL